MSKTNEKYFLFSIDLEDVRDMIPNGHLYKESVPRLTEQYLSFLNEKKMKATFFTVGDIARKYPSLIKTIISEGHEIAAHSDKHLPLNQLNDIQFRDDLSRNIDSLQAAGANEIRGFRAPTFSLTEKTSWAFEVLEELKFTYSSSVLPAKNPLFGWPEFGQLPQKIGNLLEIPMTVSSLGIKSIPVGGGVYFRLLPGWIINRSCKKIFKDDKPVLGYFHPYDIDTEQEPFMHPGINNSKLFNYLMYYGRSSVFKKLNMVLNTGATIITYQEFMNHYLTNQP